MKMLLGVILLMALSFARLGYGQSTVNVDNGWNLVGNGSNTALDVVANFGDASKVTSVWKWDVANANWQFYSPIPESQPYAASRGFGSLTTVGAGEGFWVNASSPFSFSLPSSVAVDTATVQSSLVTTGWNLVAIGDDKTPEEFSSSANLASLWAWDNASTKWYFYAPSFGSSLVSYAASKGYLNFETRTLFLGTGFWVNLNGSTTATSSTTTTSTTTVSSTTTTTIGGYTDKVYVTYTGGRVFAVTKTGVTEVKNMTGIKVIINCELYEGPVEQGIIPIRCQAGINGAFVLTVFYVNPASNEQYLYVGDYTFDEAKWHGGAWGSWDAIPAVYAAHDIGPIGHYVEIADGVLYSPNHEAWTLKLSTSDFSTTSIVATGTINQPFRVMNKYNYP